MRKGRTILLVSLIVVLVGALIAREEADRVERARENTVRANMHSLQTAIEDFAVKSAGVYPVAGDSAAVLANMLNGEYPINPYTGRRDPWVWRGDPRAPGIIAANPISATGYIVLGYGRKGLLPLRLTQDG